MIITLLRKPLEGSVADNTLKHGCGAINIDDTRIGKESRSYKGSGKSNQVYTESRAGMSDGRGKDMEFKVEGRWPANFILTHKEGCELKGTKKIKASTQGLGKVNPYGSSVTWNISSTKDNGRNRWFADKNGEEQMDDWDCVKGCPVQELDQQSGYLKSGKPIGTKKAGTGYHGNFPGGKMTGFGDEGGASRFFKQFKKGNDQ